MVTARGLSGMLEGLKPTDTIKGSAHRLAQTQLLRASKETLGEDLVKVSLAVKQAEHEDEQNIIGSWVQEYLLLNV